MAITLVVEDGTGLETANVYDLAAACETYLVDREFTVFAAGSVPQKDLWLLQATEEMERRTVSRVDGNGFPLNGDDQAMLYPRTSSVDARFRLWDSDERPDVYREGIFVLAEDVGVAAGAGTSISAIDSRSFLKSEQVEGVDLEYRRPVGFGDLHPAAMQLANQAYPAGLRSGRA